MGGPNDEVGDSRPWTSALGALHRRLGQIGADFASIVTSDGRTRPGATANRAGETSKRHAGETDVVLDEQPATSDFPRWRWD